MLKNPYKQLNKWVFSLCLLFSLLFIAGCGLVSVFGTPSRDERSVIAEYDLAKDYKTLPQQKILIIVNQSVLLNSKVNLRQSLTRAISKNLSTQLKISETSLITYDELADLRTKDIDFSSRTPAEIGKKLGADKVLLVVVNDFEVEVLGETKFLAGMLVAGAKLYDVSTSKEIWSSNQNGRVLKVGFEIEERGQDIAVARLIADIAHCITRYLYDCPKTRFKIADDLSGTALGQW